MDDDNCDDDIGIDGYDDADAVVIVIVIAVVVEVAYDHA